MDLQKLQRMQNASRAGGKNAPRRKQVRKPRSEADDQKIQAALKKINVQHVQGIDEVNMFKEDGNVIHFPKPIVHSAAPANTTAIYGRAQEKELTELVPGILPQLGADSLANLRRLAEQYQQMTQQQQQAALNKAKEQDNGDDDVPDLVENFEDSTNAESKQVD
ncbi:NAC-domain-containing protein [Wallemia mellicola CBS 633.66]|uniref:Nascent polypeptide-associated complex subunit beta n=1 Tax=Wallemia mellicola (strain ATCC MYA-4683 / CBS 633.66) TaxID=671144 RepID=I4Y839_WALMC|nr:NAC-domain-containing protein [Wallemia mellicola CBS 633.66]EIM20131.1 NAC-domain-containing protein [Wallemia mellicola CBS 633.66]|eukprot:XP_006959852.1 NAC-domain-containing protein [Wallemia mellicola CBS 633.66]